MAEIGLDFIGRQVYLLPVNGSPDQHPVAIGLIVSDMHGIDTLVSVRCMPGGRHQITRSDQAVICRLASAFDSVFRMNYSRFDARVFSTATWVFFREAVEQIVALCQHAPSFPMRPGLMAAIGSLYDSLATYSQEFVLDWTALFIGPARLAGWMEVSGPFSTSGDQADQMPYLELVMLRLFVSRESGGRHSGSIANPASFRVSKDELP